MKILITGGNGYIAKSLANKLDNTTSITRKDFNLTDRESTNNWFDGKHFDVVIHTAVVGGSRLKKDNGDTFYQNIQMFYNLLNNKHHFNKLIHFGSGAELNMPTDPYGLSKNVISKIIDSEPNFYNIRIFGVFDENELDTRFIKTCIKNYKNRKPILIHQNKLFDFIYMDDLVTIINFIILNPNIKSIDCCYNESYSLKEIAHYINGLNNHSCDITLKLTNTGLPYIGKFKNYNLNLIGLKQGINNTYYGK